MIAHVARYHRGKEPDREKHPDFGDLDGATRKRIIRLAAILDVARLLGAVIVIRPHRQRRRAGELDLLVGLLVDRAAVFLPRDLRGLVKTPQPVDD